MAGHSYLAEGNSPSPIPRRDASTGQPEIHERAESVAAIADMVAVLSGREHGSTAQALAFLRQVYPRYPLTLRLAALVAYSKTDTGPGTGSSEAPPHLQ